MTIKILKRSILCGLLVAPAIGCQLSWKPSKSEMPFMGNVPEMPPESTFKELGSLAPKVGKSPIESMTQRILNRSGAKPPRRQIQKYVRAEPAVESKPHPNQTASNAIEQVRYADQPLDSTNDPDVMIINGKRYRLESSSNESNREANNSLRTAGIAVSQQQPVGVSATQPGPAHSNTPNSWSIQPAKAITPVDIPWTPNNTGIADSPNMVEVPMYDPQSALTNVTPLDLTTALSMVGGSHPAIGLAQWRVRESYARYERARHLWLPTIRAGFSFHRHDGNLQASNGAIADVNRSSLQAGLGTGAVGAGTTPRPGILAQFHVADAIFQSRIEQRSTWASGHAATAATNDQMLEVALAYLALVSAEQRQSILQSSNDRLDGLAKLTQDFSETGMGLESDSQRVQTEVALAVTRISAAQEGVEVASTRLVRALSYDASQSFRSTEVSMIPLDIVMLDVERGSLIRTGLANRPELKESQCLVAAACQRYQREKSAPLLPSVLLGLSQTGFGGGLGTSASNWDDRIDFDAALSWELRGIGVNERHVRSEFAARVQQARFSKVAVLDQVASEVAESYAQAKSRRQRVALSEAAIATAEESYGRNLDRIKGGEGLPIEALQSIVALENAQLAYLEAVAAYNESQFQLQRAMGWPVENVSFDANANY